MKTYQEFIQEAKKCWPGYKKKGTQKLFGKTYNRCVKEDILSFAKRQEKKGRGIGPKPTKTPKELIDLAKKLEKKEEYQLEEDWSKRYKRSIDCSNPKGFSQKAHCAGRKKRAAGGETKSKPISEHCGCTDNAVGELEDGLKKLNDTSYDSIDKLMRKIMKKHKMTAKQLHNAFVDTHGKIPDEWIKQINKRKK